MIVVSSCGHKFHNRCFSFEKNQKECPYCAKQNIDIEEVKKTGVGAGKRGGASAGKGKQESPGAAFSPSPLGRYSVVSSGKSPFAKRKVAYEEYEARMKAFDLKKSQSHLRSETFFK